MAKLTNTERVAALFRANEGKWIDGREVAKVGGAYAWRSRISNCRIDLAMPIDNRQRKVKDAAGEDFTISEYRYVPRGSTLRIVHVEAEGSPETIRKAIEAFTPLLF